MKHIQLSMIFCIITAFCHPELVSGFFYIKILSYFLDRKMLKQVQHDNLEYNQLSLTVVEFISETYI